MLKNKDQKSKIYKVKHILKGSKGLELVKNAFKKALKSQTASKLILKKKISFDKIQIFKNKLFNFRP